VLWRRNGQWPPVTGSASLSPAGAGPDSPEPESPESLARCQSRRSHWHGASGPARPQLQAASTGMPGRHASASAPFRGRPIRRAVYGTGRANRRGGIILSIFAPQVRVGCHMVAGPGPGTSGPTGTFLMCA
jgi:hypothetical protein